jgi:hypothetical protein
LILNSLFMARLQLRHNISLDTDPRQQEAASPRVVVRSASTLGVMGHYFHSLLFAVALVCSTELLAGPMPCVPRVGESFVGLIPSNLRSVPACPGASRMGKGEVHWVFHGQVTLTGRIRVTLAEWGTTQLQPNADTQRQIPTGVGFVQLNDRKGDRSLHIPLGAEGEACFETMGTVRFAELSVLSDGTDESGRWVREYKVLSLAKWQRCQAQ